MDAAIELPLSGIGWISNEQIIDHHHSRATAAGARIEGTQAIS